MKKLFFCVAIWLLLSSCSEDRPMNFQSPTKITFEKRDALKKTFGMALVKALADHSSLRITLRNEALKMFDNDYDVLYHLVKDVHVTDGRSLRELLLRYFENEARLQEIEHSLPLLTLFIPTLPESSFSALLWDPMNQIPSIALTLNSTNDVTILDPDGKEYVLNADLIPGFPVVVIKENERILYRGGESEAHAKGRIFTTSDNVQFQFLSDAFDGSLKETQSSARIANDLDFILYMAYNTYEGGGGRGNPAVNGWHRDLIYYGISPAQTSGPFDYDFQEHIRSFRFINNPTAAYSLISDQRGTSDPKMDPMLWPTYPVYPPNSGWTEGGFEFEVRLLYNSKNGLGAEFKTYFGAMPQELFTVNYVKESFLSWRPLIVGLPEKSLVLPLFSWDLKDYASTIKLDIDEIDRTETMVQTDTRQVKFATNFGIEGQVLKKIGLKFGTSLEETQTQTTQKTYTVGNDPLGSVIVNFGDDVIVEIGYPLTREYHTGYYSISVEPKKVQ